MVVVHGACIKDVKAQPVWLSLKVFSPAFILIIVGIAGTFLNRPGPTPRIVRLCFPFAEAYIGLMYLFGSDELILRLGRAYRRQQPIKAGRRLGAACLMVAALGVASVFVS